MCTCACVFIHARMLTKHIEFSVGIYFDCCTEAPVFIVTRLDCSIINLNLNAQKRRSTPIEAAVMLCFVKKISYKLCTKYYRIFSAFKVCIG